MTVLINQKLLKSRIEKFNFPENEKRKKINNIISAWQTAFKNSDLSNAKETSLQGKFFAKFFCEILGYTMQDDGNEIWTLKQESKTEVEGKIADGSLGFYAKNKDNTRCVIELKDAQCNLDKKQYSRDNKQTPVEQAFQYLYKFADCDWVIVSNFRYTRLYHKSKGQTAYEEFDILTLHEEKEFKRFYYCLCMKNLLNEQAKSVMDLLIKQSSEEYINISNEFYIKFKHTRKILFNHIVENNPNYDKKLLLEKTQKLLDRFIFIFFCENTAGLLPPDTVKNIYKMGKNSFSMSECRIWEQYRGLFIAIDKGNTNVNPPINAYNGGLFAYDEILDKLIIKDEMFEFIKDLSSYDFESDLNVNILGHIFEQSLSDLAQIKNELEGIQDNKKNSKRKKDGIFYTPEYITHYIVKETIGKYLEENPDKLENIKILDPACGSGAFLNQAHSFLQKQYEIKTEEKRNQVKSKSRKKFNGGEEEYAKLNLFEHSNKAEIDRTILLNNLYGIDLNRESTEITKLALWLKTARQDKKLQNLDDNIKCGNSLIDDETIAGEKAFKWEKEFKDIMQNGGFDIIIGNPPYGAEISKLEQAYYNKFYETANYKLDTFSLFIEKALSLLKPNGILGFIIPYTCLTIKQHNKLREKLLNMQIEIIVNLPIKIFEDADLDTIILIVRKTDSYKDIEIYNINDTQFIKTNIINSFNIKKDNNFLINVNINQNDILLIDKIKNNTYPLASKFEVSQGYIPYRRSDLIKIYGNEKGNKIIDERMWHTFDIEAPDNFYPEIQGQDLYRYHHNWSGLKVKYGEWVAGYVNPKFFKNPRVLIREITRGNDYKIYADYIEECYYNTPSIINIIDTNNYKQNLLFILSLINSKLMTYYHLQVDSKANAKTSIPKILISDVKQLPIVYATKEQQTDLAEKANRMIELNKKLHEETKKALELIKLEYKPKKISQNLSCFYTLGLNPFIEELEKQGAELSLSQKEDLITWYKTKSELLNNIKKQIEILDNNIDISVYKLYNLTYQEILIIDKKFSLSENEYNRSKI